MNNSLHNYLWDCYIKSFENTEALLVDTETLSLNEKNVLLGLKKEAVSIWEKIYSERVNYIVSHVKIDTYEGLFDVKDVSFHPKFGWVIENGSHKAYLGKSSIYGDLSIIIGEDSYFSGHSIVRGNGELKIGRYCSFAFNQYINVSNQNHPIYKASSLGFDTETRLIGKYFNSETKELQLCKIDIGHDVWMGQNVGLYTNINIGPGAVIGAHSLVTKDCEPFGIYVGKPAKLIKYRFSKKIIEQLLEINWWDWTTDRIVKNQRFFGTDLSSYNGSVLNLIEN